jgi:hypothetical protein
LAGSVKFGTTGAATLVQTGVGGTINPTLIGDGSVAGAKLAAGAALANLGYTPPANTLTIVGSPPIGGGGDLTVNRTLSLTGPSNLISFNANAIPKGAGASPFAVSSIVDAGSGVTVGSPAGGAQGAGTLNATALYVNGVAAGSGGGGSGVISGLTGGQLGVASGPTALGSSVAFGLTGASTIIQTDTNGKLDATLIPNTSANPGGLCTNCNLTIGSDGRITALANGPAPGAQQLVNDVTAGPGTGVLAATVTGLQGRTVSPAMPSDQDVIAWNQASSRWEPFHTPFNAINQLTGDGTAGPGQGSQTLTLKTVLTAPGTFAVATYDPQGRATATGNLTGDVTSTGATASLVNTGVSAGSYQFGAACVTLDAKGRVTGVVVATCGGGATNKMLISTGSSFLIQTGSKLLIQ